jgi:hypothetical protein
MGLAVDSLTSLAHILLYICLAFADCQTAKKLGVGLVLNILHSALHCQV